MKMADDKKLTPGIIAVYIILGLWGLLTVLPFLWVFGSSFKFPSSVTEVPFKLPFGTYQSPVAVKSMGIDRVQSRDIWVGLDNYPLTTEGYNEITEKYSMEQFRTNEYFQLKYVGKGYLNSLIISGVVTVVVVLLAGMAAYGLARYKFKLQPVLVSLVVASMMFPVFSTIIPVYQMESSWGLVNVNEDSWTNLVAVILPQIAGNLAFSITVLIGFIKSIPVDMEEAAYLEGYSIFRIYFQIILPLAKPAFATVAIFTFLWSYNDLFSQQYFIKPTTQFTITKLLSGMFPQGSLPNYGQIAAAVVVIVIPVLIAYIFLQKNIVKGLTAGAVKG